MSYPSENNGTDRMERSCDHKEFFEKYTEEEIKEWYLLIGELAILATKVNHWTPYCVFFEYSGHVGWIRISIRRSKKQYNDEVLSSEFDVSSKYSPSWPDRIVQLNELRRKKAFMIEILAKNDIPYESAKSELHTYTEKLWSF